jgi:large subunit ribosomal protein L15
MQLHDVDQGIHKFKKRKRVGRGPGSGHGKTSSKGHKGHSSRQGFKHAPLGEGGQMKLFMRIPKRGFTRGRHLEHLAIVNVSDLDAFDAGTVVDETALRSRGLVKGDWDGVKILGDGELTKSLTVHAKKFSASAQQKIEAAGGSIVALEGPYQGGV